MSERVIDREARAQAIDPAGSFIVQAPAGSGKTGLLAQRYLRLLAAVDAPEEVLAITFTRKAAGEMRERIVQALADAAGEQPPADEHRRETWRLAREARRRDAQLGWELTRHPARLRIQTIDAFNASLTRRMPVSSGLGAPPAVTEQAQDLYAAAARRTLEELESRAAWSDAVAAFLLHLDNRLDRAEASIAAMLARRDQWLPVLFDARAGDRAALEAALAREVCLALQQVREAMPREVAAELIALAAGAAGALEQAGADSPVLACARLAALPQAAPEALAAWRGIAELLLTRDGRWRRTVNRRQGFGPDRRRDRERAHALLHRLAEEPALARRLHQVRTLPETRYRDDQWQLLAALQEMLPLAVAALAQIFAQRGEVDHTEISLRALAALGDEEQPTDLALALDHRIRHILVDEFQDTSTGQYRLLEALTRGWAPGDGHSLFLVGDPMQSIYRFREAEVGLFLRARRDGIGTMRLQPLRLAVNFRSRAPLVHWINAHFPGLLAPAEDPASGAVPFEPSAAFDAGVDGALEVHPMVGETADPLVEAEAVAALAARRLAETRDGRVAILVRGRPQAAAILPALRRHALSFRAVEVESLSARPVVQDLIALTRALVHPGDRTAWLALLRAPWCGLGLADLLVIAEPQRGRTVAEGLADAATRTQLSAQGRALLARIDAALEAAMAQARRGTLRRRVEETWCALGGPATAGSPAGLEDAEAFFALLENAEAAADLDDLNALDTAVASLYARPDPEGDERLQVMTIHKSKGLEFDAVILPGLHAVSRRDEPPLLRWIERPRWGRAPDLLLAPVRPAGQEERDSLYEFIAELARAQDDHEQGRLLYVAMTRAIRRLDLFGFARQESGDDPARGVCRAPAGSLLARLWPCVEPAFEAAAGGRAAAPGATGRAPSAAPPGRLPADWRPPAPARAVPWEGAAIEPDPDAAPLEYRWVGTTARLVGVVVHRYLQQIADDGLDAWDHERVERSASAVRARLAALGVAADALDLAQQRVLAALAGSIADAAGRWILGAHRDARSEFALCSWGAHGPETCVIDRYFVAEDGTRWVIDFKSGVHGGGDREGFLAQEIDRYREQLRRYVAALERHAAGPVRAGLYFPLMQAFCEVETQDASA